MKLSTTTRYAADLVDALVDYGPSTAREVCAVLDWPTGRFGSAVKYAREVICPEMGFAIPHPTPPEWVYEVTTDWEPVEAGAAHSLGMVESRLVSIYRDVGIVLPHLERGSVEWRRANFLNKHLGHLTGTLREINNGEG